MTLRVLFLTCHLPYPPISGGRRREFELLRRIGSDVDISLCAISKTLAEDVGNAAAMAPYCSEVRVVPAEPVRSVESSMPFQVLRHRSKHVRPVLAEAEYDVIHVEGFYLMQHVQHLAPRPIVLVEQNIEYQLWEQRAANAAGPVSWKHRREADSTRRAEQAAWRAATVVGALTEEDRSVIRKAGLPDVELVPDGLTRPEQPPAHTAPGAPPVVTFVANFAYDPNVDAAVHFARSVFPRVRKAVPDAHLMLVGNAPPLQVRALAGRHVTVTGRVPDVGEYFDAATVVVCPLRVGGGVKVKMLEALAHGKAVVTTSVGTQGLGPGIEDAVVVADRDEDMATGVVELLVDAGRRHRFEAAALRRAAELPSWDDAAAALLQCYRLAVAPRERLDA